MSAPSIHLLERGWFISALLAVSILLLIARALGFVQ